MSNFDLKTKTDSEGQTTSVTDSLIKDCPAPKQDDDFKITKKKLCCVVLNEGVSYFNIYTYYLVQFSYVCMFTFIDACQDYLLEDKDFYGIDKSKVGTINGDILLWDTLYLVLD